MTAAPGAWCRGELTNKVLKLADLAGRPDFEVGPLRISPARRLIAGPAGDTHLQPIVMKVFLLLIDASGSVVTRDELFDQAWGGVIVGDDSLNRAIARVRKVAAETAPGSFEIETVPRTGYRLTGSIVEQDVERVAATTDPPGNPSRRAVIAGGAAIVAGAAGGGWWLKRRADDADRFDRLLTQGREALEYGDGSTHPVAALQQAVDLRPDDAAAQGLLAYALALNVDKVNSNGQSTDFAAAADAAARSQAIVPNDPNARLAKLQLERSTLDLAGTGAGVRAILRTSPDSLFAMQALWDLLQTTGQSRQALTLVERSIALRPLAALNNYPLAQLLWINDRVPEADRVIERALATWPDHRYVRFARFTILAFTDRAAQARAMLTNPATRPQIYSRDAVALWQVALTALEEPTPANIARVRTAYRDALTANPRLATQAVMAASKLGDTDAAFDFANKLLLFRAGPPGRLARSTAWRFTPWLFTPPVAAMRADPRFVQLCDGVGLTDYWRQRNVRPDYPIGLA